MDAGNSKSGESSTPFVANQDSLRSDGLISPLFTAVPALNDAAAYFAETTSFITQCFTDFSAEPASSDFGGQEIVTFFPAEDGRSLASDNVSSSGSISVVPEASSTVVSEAPPIHDEITRSSVGDSSQNVGAVVQSSHASKNGISIFQGTLPRTVGLSRFIGKIVASVADAKFPGHCFERTLPRTVGLSGFIGPKHVHHQNWHDPRNPQKAEEKIPNTTVQVSVPSLGLFKLLLMLHSIGVLTEVTSSEFITLLMLMRVSLIERVQRTVRGSADDIGWLQHSPEMPPVEDGTGRFTEILDEIRHGVHRLPSSMVYLLVPGLFSNHGPLYFVSTKISFLKMGLACHIAKIHSEASVEKNAREIKEYIEEIYWGSKKRVMLLGHSKGGVDAAAALSMYWTDLKDKVAGLALAQSPYGGSPIASDILRGGQLGDYVNMRKLMEILICKVIKGDMQALEDLTYERRKEFLRRYHLPKELPVVSLHTEASISPAVLATLSRVAHAELPILSPLSAGQAATLPVVMPLGAAMAACAQLLQIRYGEKSDGLVTCRDAEVPGSVVVRPKRKLDHAWMVYSSLNDDPSEADASQVCEALLALVMEVGHKRRHELAQKDE
ncbi:hypothetical protein RJ640_014592 [Escallonia rubra]|uniref:Alpha/beta-Hydrolases superfamily protein n=1 Tax=Escallonia rubra TaxID=112253 RepID=A0AA88QRC3_9ASTE|nr:hypothetical protein RJ640_014592 [Escallonia rubra]